MAGEKIGSFVVNNTVWFKEKSMKTNSRSSWIWKKAKSACIYSESLCEESRMEHEVILIMRF